MQNKRTSKELPVGRIVVGDAAEQLRRLPPRSVDTVVTSPPYFMLRNYQAEGQIGLEGSVEDWVEHLLAVLREVARVLKPGGSLWLNLGDTYARHERYGALPKGLVLAPERLLLALSAEGLDGEEQGGVGEAQPDACQRPRSAECDVGTAVPAHEGPALLLRS